MKTKWPSPPQGNALMKIAGRRLSLERSVKGYRMSTTSPRMMLDRLPIILGVEIRLIIEELKRGPLHQGGDVTPVLSAIKNI